MNKYNERFKDAPWYYKCMQENIIIGGAGGIGSNTAYYLSKTIPSDNIYIVDDDIVEEHNIGTQFFTRESKGRFKVDALKDIIREFTNVRLKALNSKIKTNITTIAISGFDNMAARKEMYLNWKNQQGKEIFIDGRLEANVYQVFVVTPGEREEWYEKTLFDDAVVPSAPCTFKQTAYVAGLIGARITHVLVNYLSNKYANEDVYNIPFLIEENTEPFLIKTHYNNENIQ